MENDSPQYRSAMDTAVRLLTRRRHSRGELARKLAERHFSKAVIDRILDQCERLDYIDDAAAAEAYIEELKARGHGPRQVKRAMAGKAFAPELVDTVLHSRYPDDEERRIAARCLAKKAAVFVRETNLWKRKQKIYRFLYGRGFSPEVISAAVAEFDPTLLLRR